MRGLRRTEKFETDKPSNQNLKRKPRGTAELETGGQELRSACDTKQRSGERNCRKLSTETGRNAWKQACRKGKAGKHKRNGKHRKEPPPGGCREEGKGKSGKLSSQKGT